MRSHIAEICQHPVRLFYGGKELNDDEVTIGDYKIEHQHMVAFTKRVIVR